MIKVQPYLMFEGNCEEAIGFYCEVFGGEIQFLSRYKDSPMEIPAHWKEKVMHANFLIGKEQLMASDAFPGKTIVKGDQIHLSVNFDKNDNVDGPFNRLAKGGHVNMPLQNTFWGARFGQLVDRFGVNWMFNQQLESHQV